MTPRHAFAVLIYALGLVGLVAALDQLQAADHHHHHHHHQQQQAVVGQIRVKRQRAQLDDARPAVASAVSSSQATATSLGGGPSGSLDSPQVGVGGSLAPPETGAAGVARPVGRRPKKPASVAEAELALEDDEQPVRVKPKRRRRPVSRRPAHLDEAEYGDDYEECRDDYDYGRGFPEAAMGPMSHFGRMMNGMFNRMRDMAAGDFDGLPPGGSAAVASSTSGGDGYSRTSTMVNNNGRTRGFVTETRNGRTRTRRIGDDDEDEE